MGFNKIQVVGNLGRDPELSYTPQGTAICNFSIASNSTRKGDGDIPIKTTLWFKVVCWGRVAENVSQYLHQGDQAWVSGELDLEQWTDKEGNKRTTLKINNSEVKFLTTKSQSTEEEKPKPKPTPKPQQQRHEAQEQLDDDIPF